MIPGDTGKGERRPAGPALSSSARFWTNAWNKAAYKNAAEKRKEDTGHRESRREGWQSRNACAACSAGAGISRAGSVRVYGTSAELQVPLSYENRRGQAGAWGLI